MTIAAPNTSTTGTDTLKSTTLTDQVADAILRLVVEQGLQQGDRLPSANELAAHFGVSRTVVREGLAELAGRGLLTRQQGKEGRFELPGSDHLQQLLAARLQADSITRVDLHEFRSVVEIGATRLAARNRTPNDLTELYGALERLEGATIDDELNQADLDLHRAIAAAARNPLFPLVLDALAPLLYESRCAAWQQYVSSGGTRPDAIERHREIVEGIDAEDEERAVEAMTIDLVDALERLRDLEEPGASA